MFKLKINNTDVLPYVLATLIFVLIILNELNAERVIRLRYGFEYLGYVLPVIMALAVFNYVKKIHHPDGINLADLVSTDDIKVRNFRYRGSVIKATDVSFIKIYFSPKEMFIYYRNFFPIRIYNGPFTVCKKDTFTFAGFLIKEFEKTGAHTVQLQIESQNAFSNYTFYLTNVSEKDMKLIEAYFKYF